MFFITLFKPLGDHLCLADIDFDILGGIVPIKKEMHYEIKAITESQYIITKWCSCLPIVCLNLNHYRNFSSSQYSVILSTFHVDVLIMHFANDMQALTIGS